jgi:putative hydrolase of the HAD superfamily
MDKKVVVFDLDDTLFYEIDFLHSAFKEIAKKIAFGTEIKESEVYNEMIDLYTAKQNVFETITKKYDTVIKAEDCLGMYRNHLPNLSLSPDRKELLDKLQELKFSMGIITDGRSLQQRNKIKALGVEKYFSDIIISEEFGSEKPSVNNYQYYQDIYKASQFYYIGDNTKKDFVTPNQLGWITICLLDQGKNIHKQSFDLDQEFLPKECISGFEELYALLGLAK